MPENRVIALAGNPNVGKSTVFNALTGLRQHTGNWPGKTVSCAKGVCRLEGEDFTLIDTPGAYSLWAQSAEETVAMEEICFGHPDAVIVVCDAGSLERNLNLVYQVMEAADRVVVCVNLMDEAKKRGVKVELGALSRVLGVPAVGACARDGRGLDALLWAAREVMEQPPVPRRAPCPEEAAKAADALAESLRPALAGLIDPRYAALRLLENDACFARALRERRKLGAREEAAIREARQALPLSGEALSARIVENVYRAAADACRAAVSGPDAFSPARRRADRALTGPAGVPVMLLLLALVFFLTVQGANAPSRWLSEAFSSLETLLSGALAALGASPGFRALMAEGVFRTLGQVIAVMLPPMAIFFPLFTLLEDAGYLPRAAFTLDGLFRRCSACGKQALTMCMGFGCNAVGVTGCRIIDSPRERLLAVLTNSLVPCNGRFPLLLCMAGLLFSGGGLAGSLLSALMLTLAIALSAGVTLLLSLLLSKTALRGVPSSFTLELPPYRMPRVGQTLVRSALDRGVFVLGRAAAVAAPAGLLIYLLAHTLAGGQTLLWHLTRFLDPFGRFLGLDGVILAAFLLGFPANETVLPIAVMAYLSGGSLNEIGDAAALSDILRANGWTALTALNTALFSLFHFPCSTTLLTVRRETGSLKWTLLSFLLPTLTGVLLCAATACVSRLFGL